MTPYLLLLIGLFLIFVEFFMPGGILGALGAIFVIASYAVFLRGDVSAYEGLLFFLVSFVLIAGVIRLALYLIKERSSDTFFAKGDQEGYFASSWDRSLVGKEGVVKTDLRPSGHVVIEGRSYSSISLSGYLKKGTKVKVVSGEGEDLHVTAIQQKREGDS